LFDTEVLDGAEVEHLSVCRAYLRNIKKRYHLNLMTYNELTAARTYQSGIINGSCPDLQFSVKKGPEASIRLQIGRLNFVKVAAEGEGVEPEAVWAEPDGELEGIDVAPETGHVAEGQGTKNVDLWGRISWRNESSDRTVVGGWWLSTPLSVDWVRLSCRRGLHFIYTPPSN